MSAQCGHGYGKREHCDRCSFTDARKRFEGALSILRNGGFACRAEWRDGSFIGLIEAWNAKAMDGAEREGVFEHRGGTFIAISRPDGSCLPWTPTTADLFAGDWHAYVRARQS